MPLQNGRLESQSVMRNVKDEVRSSQDCRSRSTEVLTRSGVRAQGVKESCKDDKKSKRTDDA